MRIFSALVLATISLAPLVSATNKGGPNSCKKNEFWWQEKQDCLPIGGPPIQPRPPSGIECPPTGYYWGEKQKCCVPKHNPPPKPPQPQCPKNWIWYPNFHACLPAPPPPQPPKPQPSKSWQHPGHGKRNALIGISPCPTGLTACTILGLASEDYECIDTTAELESCGGCTSNGLGQDCTTIVGAWNVGCERGKCKVYTCAAGYKINRDGKSCRSLQ